MPNNFHFILIIRYSSMKDMILTAPLISVLHERFPDAFLALLTLKQYAELFRDDRRLSRVFGVSKMKSCAETDLLEKEWDLIVDLQNNRYSAAQIAQLHYRTVRSYHKSHFERNRFLFFMGNRNNSVEPVALRYILTTGEASPGQRLEYRLSFLNGNDGVYRQRVQHGEIQRPVVAFFPFCAGKNKEWNEQFFISVGQFFMVKGWNVVLMGGKANQKRAARIQRHIGYRCISLAGRLSLYECGCILQHCKLSLGCDNGLSHLARACGVKTGFIFGPTAIHACSRPQEDTGCMVFEKKTFCKPCHPRLGNFCWRLNHACMRSISPEQVITGLMELLHGEDQRKSSNECP